MNEFILELLARLKKSASRVQIKKDIQSLGKFYVDLIGRLPKSKTQQQLKNDLKNTEIKVNLTPKITKASIQRAIKEANAGSAKIDVNIGNVQQIKSASNQMNRLGNTVHNTDTFFGKLRNTIVNTFSAGKIAMTSYLFVLNEIRKAGQNAKQAIEDINKAVTDLQIATNMGRNSVEKLVKGYNDYGKSLGSTTTQITSAADDYFRAGKTLHEAQSLIKDSIMLSKLGQISSGEATEDLLAVMNGYEMSITEVGKALDTMVALDMKAAVSSGEIATALKYCASSADVAGVSFNKLAAMIATVKDKTQQSAETVGTFMNTLLSRYRDVKLGQFIDDDGEDLSDVESILGSLDIKLRDSKEEFRNFEDIINEVALSWNNYSSVQQAALAKAFAGTRQQNRFLALMEGYHKTLELTEIAANSAGVAIEKFENSYMNSLEAKKNTLQASFESLVMNSDMEEMYSSILSATVALVDFINQANLLKGIFSGLTVAGGIKAFLTIRTALNEAYIGLNKFQNALNIVKNTNISSKSFEQLLTLTNSLSASQMRLVLSSKNLSIEQKKQLITSSALSEKEKALLIQTYGLTTAETGLTAATISMGNAFRALWNTLLANPLILVTTLVSSAVMAWQSYKQHLEEIRQATEESANAYKESSSYIEEYTKRYSELREALLTAKGNEEETYNVKKQLLDLQTELNDKFGEEYGAINLVTDAYKNQTETIKSLNKEAAQSFLNENQKGIKQATDKMTKESHYNLSFTGISAYSEEGKALEEIAKKYKEQGISILKELDGSQFSIHLNADPQAAYDTINDFENDVREKAKELGDEHLFDDVLEMSSSSLSKAKDTIEKYGDIYKQALTAEIVSDDDKAKIYNEVLETVKAYNEAILQSETPYDDKKVENARQDLQALRSEINNDDSWEKYGILMDDIFDQADTRILDFNEALKNDSGLQKLANDLKGLSDLDLKSLDENIGDNKSFDKLKEAADKYDISVEELIDDLVRLGIVQGDISSEASELEEPKWDYSTTLENLDKVGEKLEVLDKSFAKLFDKEEYIGWEDLASISEAFKDMEGIEDYVKRIQEAGQDTEKVSQVFGELTGAYLEHMGVLSNVTEENAALITSMLTEMGVANAEEIVYAQLNETAETLALKKRFLAETGYEVADATLEEIAQFLNEVNASNEAKQAIAQLALEKANLNNINFDESGNIDQLISLANAAGASAMAIAKAKQAITTINSINEKGASGSAGDFKRLDYASKTLNDIKNHTYDWQYEKLNANDFKINSSPKYTPKYKGGTNTNKAIDKAKKDAEKEAKKAEDTFKKTIDFFERRVEILTAAFANLEKGMENVFGAGAKNTLLSAQIGILDEEVNNYTDALAMYRKKAADTLSGVDADLRDKIVDGAVQITDFIGKGNEDVIEAMEAYQGWADKVSDCTQKLEELKTQIRQLELQKFNNIADDFADQFDLRDSGKDLFKKEIDLIEESNRVVSDSLYKAQIDQTQKQLEILHKEKTALADQMASALKSGNIDTGTDEWLEMVDKLSEVEGNILDCQTAIEEFNNEIKQLEVDKFDRIANHYNDLCESLNSSNDLISKQIGLLEEAGELVGASYYTTQIDQLKKQLNLLDQEKKSLSDQLNTSVSSGIIKEGSEEWLEMMKTIQEVDGSILDCQTSIEEFDNAILNIHTNIFDRIQNQFSNLDSELSNLRGLFDDLEVSDEKGIWTKEGLAQLGLLAQQYELAEYRVQQYNDEINDLTTQYLAGRYSVTEYADKLSELTSAQWDAVNASENVKDAIIELNEVRINKEIEGIEKEIESFKELTDAQIKALDSAKALNDYQDSIAEKTKAVVDIERQLAAMQYDNSASTTAKRKQLEEQLAEAKKALTDAEYDHSIETQKDALNQQYEAFESERNAEIEALRLSLEQRELLISESFANVKANTETIATEISEIATNHGITVSNTLMESWKSGENAIASYGETLTTNSSVFIQELLNVESGIYGLQTQADQSSQALANMFATQADNLINELNRSYDSENQLILESYHLQDALASMFGTRADNLINELVNSYYSEANLHAMTNTLQNSLVNTLERGYNINGITNALSSIADGANSVADAANKAAQALANMGAAQNTYAGVDSGKHGFHVYDSVTGELKDTIYSDTWNYADLMAKYNHQARGIRVQKFAKGGIVSKEKDSPLDSIAKAVGEDKLVAVQYGEGIINAEEMKKINKLSEAMAKIDSNLLNPSYIRPGIQPMIPEYIRTERPNVTLHYDRMFEFNGDFNNSEQLLGQMKKVATSATTKILDEINRDFRIHGK